MKRKILIIAGPTAVGKSTLAVQLAKKLNGEIISADSRQVYRGLNIGTGKITKKEMAGVPHHLLDIADPKKQCSVADFVRLGREKIAMIFSRRRTPIICGGAGFYISTLLGEISLSPIPPNPKLRQKLAKKSARELFEMLKKIAPKRAKIIDQHNPRRLIRGIEIAQAMKRKTKMEGQRACSKNQSAFTNQMVALKPSLRNKYDPIFIGLQVPGVELKKRIHDRLIRRLKLGMITEAQHLHKQNLSWKRMEELGLEYRYLSRFLRGKISKDEMIEKLATEIWRYAKRQMTWFKKDKKIKWFLPTDLKKIWALTQGQGPRSDQ